MDLRVARELFVYQLGPGVITEEPRQLGVRPARREVIAHSASERGPASRAPDTDADE